MTIKYTGSNIALFVRTPRLDQRGRRCLHPKYEPYEVFNDEEMRQHVLSADCKLGEKLQCSESWGSSGCNKTHWTTCSCVETVKDHEAPRY